MTECMLSEERLNALVEFIHDDDGDRMMIDRLREFFAPPPGSVKVEVAVNLNHRPVDGDAGRIAFVGDVLDCVKLSKTTHSAVIQAWLPPVPPTPTVEVVS